MNTLNKLSELVNFNTNFKSAINLYLSLNKPEKINNYIPTKSSLVILRDYLKAANTNIEQATLLIGPYGKGKSHLLLVCLSILSMKRTSENHKIVMELIKKVSDGSELGQEVGELIEKVWKSNRFLPVLIQDMQGDLRQSFLYAIHDSLKRENLKDILPETYYSYALKRIDEWKKNFPNTYKDFVNELSIRSLNVDDFKLELSSFSQSALETFIGIYPIITAGSEFNPMVESDVLPLYKNISEKLVEEYNYSGIYIIFDEFSKFLEGQEEGKIGSNMKFLQDICELACDSSNAKVYITMVAHKSIKEYGKYISRDIINAFTGIEGRIVEKYFITSSKNNYELIKDAIIKETDKYNLIPNVDTYMGIKVCSDFYETPFFKSNFKFEDFKNIILEGCYPLNPMGAYLLLNISEKVAQNERTLFTFISNDEPNSMARFVRNHKGDTPWIVGTEYIYDYFSNLFKKEVVNEIVHNEWLNAEYAISKCISKQQIKMVKILALFLIVDKADELPANEKMLCLALGQPDSAEIIRNLENQNIIYRKGSTNCYVFKTRAGAALKNEIKRRRAIKGDDIAYENMFSLVTQKKFVIPQRYNTNAMMTRYFRYEYLNVSTFLSISNAQSLFDLENEFCDGKVIVLYGLEEIQQDKVKKHYKELNTHKLVVVCPQRVFKKSKQVLDLEIVQELKCSNFTDDNEVLMRELPLLEDDLIRELRQELDKIYFADDCQIFHLTKRGQVCRRQPKGIDEAVNLSCEYLFTKTLTINNEMINRRRINTGQTRKARNTIIDVILSHSDNEEFYTGTNQEATIYRSLFINTRIKTQNESIEFKEFIYIINKFIDSAFGTKVNFVPLVKELTSAPFGVRLGVLPLYFAWVISKRKEDMVIYFNDKEVIINSDIIVNIFDAPEDYALFVSRENAEKEKYISELNMLFNISNEFNLSDNRIKDIVVCMQRWFRALPQVTRNFSDTEGLKYKEEDIKQALRLKELLQKIDVNPYELLFMQLPEIFETNDDYESTYMKLHNLKGMLDNYYDWIIDKAINGTYEVFGGKNKDDLYHILKVWYDQQSEDSKRGLFDGRATNFMSYIGGLGVYNDSEITIRLVKAVTDVYIDNWNTGAYDNYITTLNECKECIESIRDSDRNTNNTISFVGRNGEYIEKNYEWKDSGVGSVLKNVIEDALDEYDDLSVNDRVAILLEMIEKVIK